MTIHPTEASARPWPYCAAVSGNCLLVDMADAIGKNGLEMALSFLLAADEGSRMTLEHGEQGLMVQVAGAVDRTVDQTLGTECLRDIRQRIDLLKK